MPAVPLVLNEIGFQSGKTFINYVNPDPEQDYVDYVIQEVSEEMSFVNNGYVLIYINNALAEPADPGDAGKHDVNVTVSAIPDNAGRIEDLVVRVPFISNGLLGPFRPIWWNEGGITQLSFAYAVVSDPVIEGFEDISIAAFSIQI